jgi:hypothetical protein
LISPISPLHGPTNFFIFNICVLSFFTSDTAQQTSLCSIFASYSFSPHIRPKNNHLFCLHLCRPDPPDRVFFSPPFFLYFSYFNLIYLRIYFTFYPRRNFSLSAHPSDNPSICAFEESVKKRNRKINLNETITNKLTGFGVTQVGRIVCAQIFHTTYSNGLVFYEISDGMYFSFSELREKEELKEKREQHLFT